MSLGEEEASEAFRSLAGTWLVLQNAEDQKSSLKFPSGHDSKDYCRVPVKRLWAWDSESLGITVLDCGLASTPAMFMSTVFEEYRCDGAIMITASHLPKDRNGFKYFSREGRSGPKKTLPKS